MAAKPLFIFLSDNIRQSKDILLKEFCNRKNGAEFEEKQYEQLLNMELGENRRIFPTGQYFENTAGVDVALFSRRIAFWRLWFFTPIIQPKRGVHLDSGFWDDLTSEWNSPRYPIKYRCNVFLQHKRPEYVTRGKSEELKHWRKPFFRYLIDEHQQDILSKLEQRVSNDALVLYSCPAFWQKNDLWSFADGGKLIEK